MAPKRLACTANLKPLIDNYYREVLEAPEKGVKTVWVTACIPLEVLRGMRLLPFWPESYAALAASRKFGPDLIDVAEGYGYSPDLCAYAKITFGSMRSGQGPLAAFPKPDIVIAANNQCMTVQSWWREMARFYDVPCFIIDTPRVDGDPTLEQQTYVIDQLKEMIDFIELSVGNKLDDDHYQEVIAHSNAFQVLYGRILDSRKASPIPYTGGDLFTHLFPAVTLGGTPEAVSHYRLMLEEVEGRIARREGPVPEEKYRLLWDNIPMWYRLGFFDYLADRGALFATDTYTDAWRHDNFLIDPDDPFPAYADRLLTVYTNRGVAWRTQHIVELVDEYKIDGLLIHSNHSCKYNSLGQVDINEAVRERIGVPALLFDADQADGRFFNEEQTRSRVETFLEMLDQRKGAPAARS